MNRASVWFVVMCVAKIVFTFSITNKLSIDNLTAIPELITNINDSYIDISVDEFDIGNANESLNLSTKADLTVQSDQNNYSIGPTSPAHNTHITPNEHWRSAILKHQTRTSRSFFGLFIIPYIICFFAAKGFWPFYPSMLQYQVNEMGKKVFSQSDDRIRQFCCGKFNFQETCYRPVVYKGYFVPVDATDCPPIVTSSTAATTAQPAAQSWAETPARIASPKKPVQQNTDVEVFDSGKSTTPSTKVTSEKTPNINIEIHNVFSFGNGNSSTPPQTEESDGKISETHRPGSPVIYA